MAVTAKKKNTKTTKKDTTKKKSTVVEPVVEEITTPRKEIPKKTKENDMSILIRDFVYEYYDIDMDSGERMSKTQKAELASITYNALKKVVDSK